MTRVVLELPVTLHKGYGLVDELGVVLGLHSVSVIVVARDSASGIMMFN